VSFQLDTSTEFGARVERRLREEEIIWLATVNMDGTPEPSPVWFYWDGQTILVYSKTGTARERNVRRGSRVALHFDSGEHGSNIVVFVGDALVDDAASPPHAMPEYAAKYRAGFARIGVTAEQFSYAYPLAIRIRPQRVRGY
jgi:PPOX class probable F420-dependent enzyme